MLFSRAADRDLLLGRGASQPDCTVPQECTCEYIGELGMPSAVEIALRQGGRLCWDEWRVHRLLAGFLNGIVMCRPAGSNVVGGTTISKTRQPICST